MLISFHYCVIFIFQILRNRKRLKSAENSSSNTVTNDSDLENDLKFDPPVYRQRYSKVYETLINEKWRNNIQKLVDFGCAEFGLFIFIKNLNIKQISFVDIDATLLQEKIGKIEPLLVDQIRRRNDPLEVSVFAGSVADPDYRLQKTDVVTAIELIEHLYPDTLDAFPFNIFSFIEPKLVIITTPNADFNILFNRQGFRHSDHKFEWTREQFEDWARNIVERFPNYTVDFCGIGESPEGTKNVGCCSQMALFLRKDLIYDKYISPLYSKTCLCDKDSPCKGETTECKLLCGCVCPLCLPNFSVGICTLFSRSKDHVHNVEKDSCSKKPHNDTNLEFHPTYYTFNEDNSTEISSYINPSHNIYYKIIQKIDYPYEIDIRSENERLLQTFLYRIQVFSHFNSRFYVSKTERCEIPITDLMYGDIDISVEEARHLLINSGYQIEECILQETGSCEDCIISMPQEMEEITSSSEVTDGYSSKSSEPNDSKIFEPNIESLSDWDEIPYAPKPMQQGNPSSSVESTSESKKPNPDPLFDSGYLKSPSPLETTSKLPHQENWELAETDQFEDVLSTPSLSSEDNKLHLKKSVAKEKFVAPLMLESHKQKYDPNRVNELDRFHNMSTAKTFMNNFLKPQNEFKKAPFKELPVAGPSSGWKKSRKFKDKKVTEKTEKKEITEPSPLDDAKSITNCIIQNSLNKIDVDDEIIGRQAELIRDLSPPPQEINQDIVVIPEQQQVERVGALEIIQLPLPQGVENGDLANNNRDNEGNNFVAANVREQDIDEGIDLLNDNLEELMPLPEDNVIAFDNNNDLAADGNNLEIPVPINHQDIEEVEENHDANGAERNGCLEADDSVAHASREALFDANSEQDLLEDFDIPPQANHDDVFDRLNLGSGVVLVGLHSVNSNGIRRDQSPAAASIQTNTSSFPNWLLQILGNHITTEDAPAAPLGSHDEPHFYCQGDGLGVHPSVIALEVDEAEEADNDTSTEESSSNNTADFAEVEPGPSEMFDMSSLPEESSLATSLVDDSAVQAARTVGSVIWPERRPNNDTRAISDHVIHGTEIVNEIIRMAVKEVILLSRRSSSASLVIPDNSLVVPHSSLLVPDNSETDVTQSQSCCIVNMSESQDGMDPEEIFRHMVARTEPAIAAIQEPVESNVSDGQNESFIAECDGSILDAQSSNGSEDSKYYDA